MAYWAKNPNAKCNVYGDIIYIVLEGKKAKRGVV